MANKDGSVSLVARLDTTDVEKGTSRIKTSLNGISAIDRKFNWSGLNKGVSVSGLLTKATDAVKSGLSAVGSAAIKMGKVGVGAVGGIASAISGLSITGGIARAMAIGEAEAKMNQLGMNTESIMASVNTAVTGTKFALNEAASSAVTLGAAGVAAGEDMTQALQSIASTASISGAEFGEIGAIYSKVAASGKLSAEVMNQLLERGVSVTAALSKKLGVTQETVREMVKKGQIDFKTFSEAMQEYLGDAADSANSTFSGAMANVRAALSRVGAAFASPALEALRRVFVALIPVIKQCVTDLEPLTSTFSDFCTQAADAIIPNLTGIVDWIKTLLSTIFTFFGALVSSIDFEGLASAFGNVAKAFSALFADDLATAATTFGQVVAKALNGMKPVLEWISPILEKAMKTVRTFFDSLVSSIDYEGISAAFGMVADAIASVFSEDMATTAAVFGQIVADALNGIIPLLEWLIPVLEGFVSLVQTFFNEVLATIDFEGFSNAFHTLGDAFKSIFSEENSSTAQTFGTVVGNAINLLIPVIQMLTPVVQFLAQAIKWVAENINWLLPLALVLVGVITAVHIAFSLLSFVSTVAGFLSTFSSAASASGAAAAKAAPQYLEIAAAAIAIGAGVALACAGIFLLVQAAIQLAGAGPGAIAVLVGLVAIIGAFTAAMVILGPTLTASAVGMVALGAAVALVGAGLALAGVGAALVAAALPSIASNGASAAGGLLAFSGALAMATPVIIAFGAAAAAAAIGAAALSAVILILSVASMTTGAGLLITNAALLVLAASTPRVTDALNILAAAFPRFAGASASCVPGMAILAAAFIALAGSALVLVPAFTVVVASTLLLTTGSGACTASLLILIATIGATGVALTAYVVTVNLTESAVKGLTSSVDGCSSAFARSCSTMLSSVIALGGGVRAQLAAISASFASMRLHIPSPTLGALPHFSMSGRFDPKSGAVPTIGVNWYAKGGIFNSASIIGIAEKNTEAAVPLRGREMLPFANAVAEGIGTGGSGNIQVTINVNIDRFINSAEEDIDELVDRIARDTQRKLDYQMRAKGLSA